jgi:response regulator of citrate/malate metabolism
MELNPQLTKEKFENHLRNLIDKVKNLDVEMNEEEYKELINEVYTTLNFHSLHREVSMDNTKKILKDSYDKTINEMTDKNQLMFIDDVMKDFGISRSTLRRWNNLGLKKIKVKRKVYYMRNDIMTFLKNLND